MRTDQDILNRITEIDKADFFGFQSGDLIGYLSFDAAKPYLKEGVTEKEWEPLPREKDDLIKQITEYMDFAWDKANNQRGISASRSIDHMKAWLWMLGEENAAKDLDEYEMYGKPQLAAICEKYGVDWKSLDDGYWSNNESLPHTGTYVAELHWNAE